MAPLIPTLLPPLLLLLWAAAAQASGPRFVSGRTAPYLLVLPEALFPDKDHLQNIGVFASERLRVQVTVADASQPNVVLSTVSGLVGGGGAPVLSYRFNAPSARNVRLNISVSPASGNGSLGRHLHELPVLRPPLLLYVQFERPEVRPGQNLSFRLFGARTHLTPALRPVPLDEVGVEDSEGRRVARWSKLDPAAALGGLSWAVPQLAQPGRWRVCARSGRTEECRAFSVVGTIPDRPDVELRSRLPTYLALDANRIKFDVCAGHRTPMGPLRATINVKLCVEARPWAAPMVKSAPRCLRAVREMVELRPCVTFSESTAALGLARIPNEASARRLRLRLVVRLVEDVTGASLTQSVTGGRLVTRPFRLTLDSPDEFKPGLPFFGLLTARQPDGSPASGQELHIDAPAFPLVHRTLLRTNSKGEAALRLPPLPATSGPVNVTVRAKATPKDRPMVRPEVRKRLRPARPSRMGAYLLAVPRELPKGKACPEQVPVRLYTTVPIRYVYLKMVATARGNLRAVSSKVGTGLGQRPCEDTDDAALGHYTCLKGKKKDEQYWVKCRAGWRGDNCLTPICAQSCVKGWCQSPGRCLCRPGWAGSACNRCVRRPGCRHGHCSRGADCVCRRGWEGPLCAQRANSSDADGAGASTRLPPVTLLPRRPVPKAARPRERLTVFLHNEKLSLSLDVAPEVSVALWFEHRAANSSEQVLDVLRLPPRAGCLASEAASVSFRPRVVRPGWPVNLTVSGPHDALCALTLSRASGPDSGLDLGKLSADLERGLRGARCDVEPLTAAPESPWWQRAFRGIGAAAQGSWPSRRRRRLRRSAAVELWPAPEEPASVKHLPGVRKPADDPLNISGALGGNGTWRADALCLSKSSGGLALSSAPALLQVRTSLALALSLPVTMRNGSSARGFLELVYLDPGCVDVHVILNATGGLRLGPGRAGRANRTFNTCQGRRLRARVTVRAASAAPGAVLVAAETKAAGRRAPVVQEWLRRTVEVLPRGRRVTRVATSYRCTSDITQGSVPLPPGPSGPRALILISTDLVGRRLRRTEAALWRRERREGRWADAEAAVGAVAVDAALGRYLSVVRLPQARAARVAAAAAAQRLLRLQRPDGGFAGSARGPASTWLTAAALRALVDSAELHRDAVDAKGFRSMGRALRLLLSRQRRADGCLVERARVRRLSVGGAFTHRSHGDPLALTAAVLAATERLWRSPGLTGAARRLAAAGQRCLSRGAAGRPLTVWSAHRLAVVASAAAPNVSRPLLAELRRRAVTSADGRRRYWLTRAVPAGARSAAVLRAWRTALSDVETSALAAAAALRADGRAAIATAAPVAEWLAAQEARGRWHSLADRAAALRALADLQKLAGGAGVDGLSVTVFLRPRGAKRRMPKVERTFAAGDRWSSFVQETPDVARIHFTFSGQGCALVRVVRRFYEPLP